MSTTTATSTTSRSRFSFTLPQELVAKEPPERRGIARDAVRLMVIDRSEYRLIIPAFMG
jgi:S-adenosylmethionine:tRNA-ribosyltransferase-isomerase (queuine synthetase)